MADKLIYKVVEDLNETYKSGDARFWINDSFPGRIELAVLYNDHPGMNDRFVGVGLVDEEMGGMIAYGKEASMERLATMLNKLDAIEKIAASTNR